MEEMQKNSGQVAGVSADCLTVLVGCNDIVAVPSVDPYDPELMVAYIDDPVIFVLAINKFDEVSAVYHMLY